MKAALNELGFSWLLLTPGDPDRLAVIDNTGRHTFSDLRAAVGSLVVELRSLGLPKGSRIGLLGANSFFWVAAYIAAMEVGVVVPLAERTTAADLDGQLDWVDGAAVLMDRRTQRRLGGVLRVPVVTDASITEEADRAAGAVLMAGSPVDLDADVALMFTSGTTGRPKAVRLTHRNLHANTQSIISYLGLNADDRALVILPFHYCYGASLLHTHLAVGGAVVLCNTFTFPQTAVDLISRESCTVFAGVPSSFQLLLRASDYGKRPLESLRIVQQAGGRLAPQRLLELAKAQPASQLFVMYGQTEATARLSYLPPALIQKKSGSIGKGIPGVQLRVVDDKGQIVPPGVQGEIMAAGANISPGYFRDPEGTEEKFPNGELRTGDLATVDDDGYIFIVGRSAEFIKSWGHRVAPQQVEEAVTGYRGIAEAVAVGLPDPDAGEAIVLTVVPEAGTAELDQAALMRHLRDRLPKHMLPSAIRVLESLPLNSNGKVSRAEVRRLLESRGSG